MRPSSAIALLLLAGCSGAHAVSTPPGSAPATVRTTSEGIEILASGSSTASTYSIPVPPGGVWPALVRFYGDRGIPFTVFDPTSWTAGNQDLQLRRRWAGAPVSAVLDCGTVAGSSIADTYLVRMRLLSSLVPVGTGASELRVQVAGTATNPTAGNRSVRCTSTGRLEQEMLEALRTGTSR
ncbi:MAG TPA: hypothetical protein VHG51_19495 [Longimicrobiaceae bacterium]|nr:hypothetical protein [Longimicrobiaceae bacterium]